MTVIMLALAVAFAGFVIFAVARADRRESGHGGDGGAPFFPSDGASDGGGDCGGGGDGGGDGGGGGCD